MMEWKEVKLDSLVNRKICYGIVQAGPPLQNGVPIVKVQNIVQGLDDISSLDKTSDDISNQYKRTILKGGELLITLVGTVGLVDIAPKDFAGANIIRNVGLLDITDNNIKQWVKYYIRTREGQHYIMSNLNTTVQKALNIKELCAMPIPMPNESYMQKAVSILSSLDSKIETNNKINAKLEEMAQALFKSWFVDFEPFKDKGMVESELGMIPEGWRVGSLTEIATYTNGLAMQKFPPEDINDSYPVLKIKELGQGCCDSSSDRCSKNIREDVIVYDGDVIFSWSGTLLVDLWCGGECGLNQHLFKVTSSEYPKWFYLYWTKHHLNEFIRIAKDKAVTMGHIKRGHLESALVAIPNENDMKRINDILTPIVDKIVSTRVENRNLSLLRDTLLPKLMSGEIDLDSLPQ